tara:strand:+ start:400 stop:1137 length:738 start_codon:yes stop_codon:yes gene_type:complete
MGIALIAGCSHSAGFEIDGTEDSAYNRSKSFGSVLSSLLQLTPHNISLGAQSNSSIARSVIDYLESADDESVEFVVVGWTEASRIDLPSDIDVGLDGNNPAADSIGEVSRRFLQINAGWDGNTPYERSIMPYWHEYMYHQGNLMSLVTVKEMLLLQQYLYSKGIDYVFCNTMLPYNPNRFTEWYWDLIDDSKCMWDAEGFWFKYKELGHVNSKAKYWHHDETPHRLWAELLYNHIATRSDAWAIQ